MFVQKKKANIQLSLRNIEINQKNEEISAQRDEIEAQRDLVTYQKDHIEEIHKEVIDSINYAERIQRSFLATKELLDENLKEYFVFFRPKDVVSGDFYWAGKLNNGIFILVTADSTGHGVPGAIMSILNISSLEKAVEQGLCEPSEILNHTRKNIIERLKKDGSPEGGKDGMDASLICFDYTNRKLTYSAANNPIWIIRENTLIELLPDKMPVGKHDKDQMSFTQNEFQFQNGDIIYTITDGFADQFGGPKGKKFLSKNLKQLLLDNSNLPMSKQKTILENTLISWVGEGEQIDDITLLGLKI
jgi:serine phosphatase RsbU (regulator of sigma subunit)